MIGKAKAAGGTDRSLCQIVKSDLSMRLCAAAFFVLFLDRDEQLEADLGVTLEAGREFFLRLEGCFMWQAVLGVGNLIDPRPRDHLARLVLCLAGIGSHALCPVASGT